MPTGFSTRSLVPDEHLPGYAQHVNLTDGWLLRPGRPLEGRVVRHASYPTPAIITIHTGASEFPTQVRRLLIWQAAYDAVIGGIGRTSDSPLGIGVLLHPNSAFVFRWRPQNSSGAWTEVPGEFLSVNLSTATTEVLVHEGTITSGTRIVGQVKIEDRRLDPTDALYDATAPDMPATTDIIEFFLIGPMPPDKLHPAIVEGITDGEFCINAYDGIYSARDPNTGAIVPTGITYDRDAFDLMTNPVRIRLDAPIEDLRDFLEKHIYQPSGMFPALNAKGEISPVSQVAPQDSTGLAVIDDSIGVATPDWDAGQEIINVVKFIYPRDYSIGKPDMPPRYAMMVRQNLLDAQDVVMEFRDEISIERHGEQVLEIDGSAYRAIGLNPDLFDPDFQPWEDLPPRATPPDRPRGGQWVAPGTPQEVVRPSVHVVPVSGNIQDEVGWQLAQARGTHLLNRFSFGAPSVSLSIIRAALPDLRTGDWVILQLAHFPDYITQRRGLVAMGQVVAIADLNCGFRKVLVEMAYPVTAS